MSDQSEEPPAGPDERDAPSLAELERRAARADRHASADDRDRAADDRDAAAVERSAGAAFRAATELERHAAAQDRAMSDLDRRAAESDRHLADRHRWLVGNDEGGPAARAEGQIADRRATERDRMAQLRDRHAAERDRIGRSLTRSAERRDTFAELRDLAAEQRDLAARARDVEADARDMAARVRDHDVDAEQERLFEQLKEHGPAVTALARELRLNDALARFGATRDRAYASHDRDQARADRTSEAAERPLRSFDPTTGAIGRSDGVALLERLMADDAAALHMALVRVGPALGAPSPATAPAGPVASGESSMRALADAIRSRCTNAELVIRFDASTLLLGLLGRTDADVASVLEAVEGASTPRLDDERWYSAAGARTPGEGMRPLLTRVVDALHDRDERDHGGAAPPP